MLASSAKLTAQSGAPISISRRGPTWSTSQPISGAHSPTVPTVTEKPSETWVRLQPKRSSNGSTYAPNEPKVAPSATIRATTIPTSTHQP